MVAVAPVPTALEKFPEAFALVPHWKLALPAPVAQVTVCEKAVPEKPAMKHTEAKILIEKIAESEHRPLIFTNISNSFTQHSNFFTKPLPI